MTDSIYMNHPERCFQEQWERIERLLKLTQALDHHTACPGLTYYDLVVLSCQAMWSFKDWVLSDPEFGAANMSALKADIYNSKALSICADLANGTKHFRLNGPKTDFAISDQMGIHVDGEKGIFRHFFYLVSIDQEDALFGMESRDFLVLCKAAWESIVNTHYLSEATLEFDRS